MNLSILKGTFQIVLCARCFPMAQDVLDLQDIVSAGFPGSQGQRFLKL